MSTIVFKCDSCGMTLFGDTDRNVVNAHLKKVNNNQVKFIDKYHICDNCLEYDRKKYMEV